MSNNPIPYCQPTENNEQLKTDDDSDQNSKNIESASDFVTDDNSYSEYNRKNEKEPMSDDSINAVENWKGRGKEEKVYHKPKQNKRKTKYMESTKEIDGILSSKCTRSTLNTLLINGNKKTPISISKKKFLIQNTCPFDAVSVLIAMAYTDIVLYKQFIDTKKNDFLIFCKNLAQEGPTLNIYKNRVVLLRTIFQIDASIKDTNLIDARYNVTLMITGFLRNAPSSIQTVTCLNNCHTSKVIHDPLISLKLTDKFNNLEEDIKTYTAEKTMNCTNCNGTKTTSRSLREHLFIEVDFFSGEISYELQEFPDYIDINKDRYYKLNHESINK